jgi:DUF4097 and DUF4098 domain-containing protein YvlB
MSRFWLKWSGVFLGLALMCGLATVASAKRDLQRAGLEESSLTVEMGDWALRLAESRGDGRFIFKFSSDDESTSNGVSGSWLPVPCAGSEDLVFAAQGMAKAEISSISARIRVAESSDEKIHVKLIRTSQQCKEEAKKPRLHATLNSGGRLKVELKENDDYAPGEVRELVVSIPKSNTGYFLEVNSVSGELKIEGIQAAELDSQTVSGDTAVNLASPPEKWEHESVSGDLKVKSTVKPLARLEMESVSGDLKLSKAWGYSVESTGGPGKQALEASPAGQVKGRWGFSTVSGDITLE